MWITKDDCKEGNHAQSHGVAAFEYLYSHVQYTEGQHTSIDDRQNSNINMYIGCEKPGGYDVGSTVEGTVLRFNIIDDASNWVLFDYPMTASGSFDTITHDWVSIILTVTRHQVHVFVDGAVVEDSTFGFPTDARSVPMRIGVDVTVIGFNGSMLYSAQTLPSWWGRRTGLQQQRKV